MVLKIQKADERGFIFFWFPFIRLFHNKKGENNVNKVAIT